MGLIQDFVQKFKNRNERVAQLEAENRAQQTVGERMLTADERELLKIRRKEHLERVKAELNAYRQKENAANWHSNPIFKQPSILKEFR